MSVAGIAIRWTLWTVCGLLAAGARAQVSRGRYLYTSPDPDAGGGIAGEVRTGTGTVSAVFAMPQDDPASVYKATLSGPDNGRFAFAGLPAAKYDLFVLTPDAFYEGFRLAPKPDRPLTAADRERIRETISRIEPYFNRKIIHRLEGRTGDAGAARCLCTFLRARGSVGFIDGKWYPRHRRSFKLVLLEPVGPGWQVTRTREIANAMVAPGTGEIRHVHAAALGNVRVVDQVKEIGKLDLAGGGSPDGGHGR